MATAIAPRVSVPPHRVGGSNVTIPAPVCNFEVVGSLADWLERLADDSNDDEDDDREVRYGLGPNGSIS